jgi:hypothetical protein
VQDESLKASANKIDPYAAGGMASEAGMALRGSQRAALEVIDPSLASFFSPFSGGDIGRFDWLERTRSWREVNLLLADQDQVDSLLSISPHLTFWSYGVKADSWHGGLKYDLSLAFEADDDTFNAMDAFGGGNLADAFSPNPAINAGRFPTARGGAYEQHYRHGTNPSTGHTVPNANQRVKYVFMEPLDYDDPPNRLELQDASNNTIWTPMNSDSQTAYTHAQGGYIRGPTWHQLRDHYRSYKHVSGSGANAVFRNQTVDEFHSQYLDSFIRNRNSISSDILTQARYIRSGGTAAAAGNVNNWTPIVRPLHAPKAPVMIRERWLFSLAPRLNDGVYEFDVVINPVYTLWNPYDTAIEVDRVEIRKHNADLSFGLAMFYSLIDSNSRGYLVAHNGTGNFSSSSDPIYPQPSGYENSRLATLVYRQFPELFADSGLGSNPTPDQILDAGWTLTALLTSSGTSGGGQLVFQPGEIKTFSVNAGGGAAAVDPERNSLVLYLGPEADAGTLQSFSGFHFENVLTVDTTTLEADTAAMFPPPPPEPPTADTNGPRRYSPLTHDLRFNFMIRALSQDSMVSEPLTEIRMITGGESIRTAWHWIAFGRPHASGAELEMHANHRTYDVWVGWIHWPSNANYFGQGFLVENFFNPQAPDKQIVAAADVFLKPKNYIVWQGHNARRFNDYPVPVLGLFNPVAPMHLLTNGPVGPYPVSDIFDANFFPLYEWDGAGQFAIGLPADGEGYWGDGITGAPGDVSRVVAYSIPREPLLSLGDLRHANIANYHTQPTYTVGESFASPYVSPNGTWARYEFSRARWPDGNERSGRFHNSIQPIIRWQSVPDWTYLINEALWDGFFFSGLAPRATQGRNLEEEFQAFIAGEYLANSRTVLIPGSEDALAEIFTASGDLSVDAYKLPARFTLNKGVFNINSTSVEAWKAMIASTEGIRVVANVGGMTDIQSPSDRALPRHGLPLIDTDHVSSDWSGYLTLTDNQLDDLAQAMVDEVRARGPFTSMGDFVNRRLAVTSHDNPSFSGMTTPPTSPPAAHTRMGAVQAAITSTTINNGFNERMDFSPTADRRTPRHPRPTEYPYPDHLHEDGLLKLGVPQYLTQGDLLQVLGPALSARSDTFTIRCYGDLEDPVTGEVKARVWGEAVVQRFPEPVVPSAVDEYEPDDPEKFGRRFRIISFNWLSPETIN